MDSLTRSLGKTFSWRVTATIITTSLTYALTGGWKLALSVGTLDSLSKLFAYFLHERAWNHIPFGQQASAAPLVASPTSMTSMPSEVS